MGRGITHKNNNEEESVKNIELNGWNDDMPVSGEDSLLFRSFSEYMRGHLDIEDVKNDLELPAVQEMVKEMVAGYNSSKKVNKENETFIKEILTSEGKQNNVNDEITSIKQEIDEKNLDLVTAQWVKEWHERKQRTGSANPKTEEIRNFITESLNPGKEDDRVNSVAAGKKGISRKLYIRYISLSAAAITAVILLIRTLLPSSDHENLFTSYYKPFDAVSPVTRNVNSDLNIAFSSAISNYKKGDYKSASDGLETVLKMDPSSSSAEFFLGLSQLELGSYDIAVKHLLTIAGGSGDYSKEARWYLGLIYLKTGNRQKASECFESLVKSNGYYHDRSVKILRRLK